MLSTVFFPVFPFLLHIGAFALWGTIAIWLASIGTENCNYQSYTDPNDQFNGRQCDCREVGEVGYL